MLFYASSRFGTLIILLQITYDPSAVSYDDLLTVFWDLIDPTTLNRQGGDAGTQYRSGIHYHDESQQQVAERCDLLCNLVFYPSHCTVLLLITRPHSHFLHITSSSYFRTRSVERQQQKLGAQIVTEVLPATTWYPAEDYHQQYLSKGGQCSRTGDLTPIRCYG